MLQTPVKHKFTIAELHQMEEAFAPGQRIELLEGDIIDISPINPPHATGIPNILLMLLPAFPFTASSI